MPIPYRCTKNETCEFIFAAPFKTLMKWKDKVHNSEVEKTIHNEILRRIAELPAGEYSIWPYWAKDWLEHGPPKEFHAEFLRKAQEDSTLFAVRGEGKDIHPAEYLNL